MDKTSILEQLPTLRGWHYEEEDNPFIQKKFQFPSFIEAIQFVNRVANAAEDQNHHPDIFIQYNQVIITLWSHDQNQVTERDLRLAKAIEELV